MFGRARQSAPAMPSIHQRLERSSLLLAARMNFLGQTGAVLLQPRQYCSDGLGHQALSSLIVSIIDAFVGVERCVI